MGNYIVKDMAYINEEYPEIMQAVRNGYNHVHAFTYKGIDYLVFADYEMTQAAMESVCIQDYEEDA